jgi:uncharacterized membrane protein YphA (DoxX/SURF4 family)
MEVAMEAVTLSESEAIRSAPRSWSPTSRIAFRFCFIYFGILYAANSILYTVLSLPKLDAPDWTTSPPIRAVVFWVGAHLFALHPPFEFADGRSGDKYYDWVFTFCALIATAVATVVWSILDRRRQEYATLHAWFWLALRFCLGATMFVYGSLKVVPLQMLYPSLGTLVEPFGNMSPFGLLWASVGSSPAYEAFAGCAELLGGILLIFPRTVTLGALICLADMIQVFALNMTYDVPVKLYSFHLILISLLILQPNLKPLASFFFLNRHTQLMVPKPLFSTRRAQRIALVVIAFIWLRIIAGDVYQDWNSWHSYGPGAPKPPLYGIWNIEEYTLDGKPLPLLVTGEEQWRRVIFSYPNYAVAQRMDGSSKGYTAKVDLGAHTLNLTDSKDKNWKANFSIARPAPDRLTLDGIVNGQKAELRLRLLDHTKFMLVSRGFHWTQEYPFAP